MKILRDHFAFALVLLPLAVLYLWLNASDDLGSLRGDGLIYVNTARHYAPYWPADEQAATWAHVTQFPPAYAAVLAATGGAFDFRLAHGITTVCLLASFAALYAWLIQLGIPRLRATVATALFAVTAGTFLQSFLLHPEGLYVALGFTALSLLVLGEQTPRTSAYWVASAAVAVAILTRTVGVTLVPALWIALARNRPRGWPVMAAAAVAPGLLWSLLHHPPWSYADTLKAEYAGAPLESILATVLRSMAAAGAGFADNLLRAAHLQWVVVSLGAIAAAVALWRFVRWRPDAWYLAAYLAALALWPYPQEAQRLTWVVVPLLLGYVVWAGDRLAPRVPAARMRPAVSWAPVAVLALIVLPEFALLMGRATHPLARATPAYRHVPEWYEPRLPAARRLTEAQLGTVQAFREFATQIPRGECVFSTLPMVAAFYTGRDARFPPWESTDDRAFMEETRQAGCRYFVFTLEPGRGYTRAYYPLDRLGDRVQILAEQPLGAGGERPAAALAVLKD
jgi:hypothetical protein